MLGTIMLILHSILMMGTLALTYQYYGNLDIEIPTYISTIIYAGVAGVSVLWALGYAVIGISFGLAAGGLLEGLKMGGILGIGLSVGRLWPYIFTFSLGSFLSHSPAWHTITSFFIGILCLAVNYVIKFVWAKTNI